MAGSVLAGRSERRPRPAMVKSMFLVHARFEVLEPAEVPLDIGSLIRNSLVQRDAVEHLSVHPLPPRHFVLGFYLLSESLAEAEAGTEVICRRLLGDRRLPPATLLSVGVPLLAPLIGEWRL